MGDTYRCLACGGLYVDPAANGRLHFHVCPPVLNPATLRYHPIPGARDERLVQDRIGGPPRMVAHGKGRILVAVGDALEGAIAADILALQQAPALGAIPHPEPILPWPANAAMVADASTP